MTIVSLGSLSVGAAVPGMSASITAGLGGINAALPDLLGELIALQAIVPTPPSMAAQLVLAQQLVSSLEAGLHTPGFPIPDITANLAAVIAALAAKIGAMQAQLAILTGLTAPLGQAGVSAWAYDGAIGSLGGELSAAVGGGGTHANALALVATDPAAWSALSVVMKVTP